jgi:cytochrome c biogenesis factor
MNQYETMREPIGTPDVYSTIRGDFYLSAMNINPAERGVSVNAIVTPFVGWIWGAVILMGLGGLASVMPSVSKAPGRAVAAQRVVEA